MIGVKFVRPRSSPEWDVLMLTEKDCIKHWSWTTLASAKEHAANLFRRHCDEDVLIWISRSTYIPMGITGKARIISGK